MVKINIDERYSAEKEIRKDVDPYLAFYECFNHTFNLSEVESVCDIGCATGHLTFFLKERHGIDVKGYEYFDFHKNSEFCQPLIKDDIEILDIRDPLPDTVKKYDIVNCTEVGEYIDPDYANTLIENCKKLSKKYIVFTWSSPSGKNSRHTDQLSQHLNPLPRKKYIDLLRSHGLIENMELTAKFLIESRVKAKLYSWWKESFIIWEIK